MLLTDIEGVMDKDKNLLTNLSTQDALDLTRPWFISRIIYRSRRRNAYPMKRIAITTTLIIGLPLHAIAQQNEPPQIRASTTSSPKWEVCNETVISLLKALQSIKAAYENGPEQHRSVFPKETFRLMRQKVANCKI